MTHFEIISPRTSVQLYPRLTDPERCALRSANIDRLEYMRTTDFAADGPPTIEAMIVLQAMVLADYKIQVKSEY